MIKDQIFWWIESNLQFKAEMEWRFLDDRQLGQIKVGQILGQKNLYA